MSKNMKRTTRYARSITLQDLANYKTYMFTWFTEIALKLCTGESIESITQDNVQKILEEVSKCSNQLIEEARKTKTVRKDPCSIIPAPVIENDPKDRLNLCAAHTTLVKLSTNLEPERVSPPSFLSIEFAEHTRSFMGSGRKKIDLFKIGSDVLALSIIGAYLSQAYIIENEYGYVFVEVIPYRISLEESRKLNTYARRITKIIKNNDGSISTILLGISSSINVAIKETVKDIGRSSGHLIFNYLRLIGRKVRVDLKGFDTIDLISLSKILGGCGVSYTVYNLLYKYPRKEYNSLRRFIELMAINLIKFQNYRKPYYIYEIIRHLTSKELNEEGVRWYGKEGNGKKIGWNNIVNNLFRLSLLVDRF